MVPPVSSSSKKLLDVSKLSSVNDEQIIKLLRDRLESGKMYTFCGDELLCMYTNDDAKGHFSDKVSDMYSTVNDHNHFPHIYLMASQIYQNMMDSKENQVLVFTGVSGSGKTRNYSEALKEILKTSEKQPNALKSMIGHSHKIMDAFGNAQSTFSVNSTRYCRHFEIIFNESGTLSGAVINEYLLEKSRIYNRSSMEEANFHVFYYMMEGLQNEGVLADADASTFKYLETSARIDRKQNFNKYQELVTAMKFVGFTTEEQQSIFAILCAVLKIGNIEFETDGDNDVMVKNYTTLSDIASILEADVTLVESVLTGKITGVGDDDEPIVESYSLEDACYVRDAWSSSIYERLFGYVCHRLNEFLSMSEDLNSPRNKSVALVDMFGFENWHEILSTNLLSTPSMRPCNF